MPTITATESDGDVDDSLSHYYAACRTSEHLSSSSDVSDSDVNSSRTLGTWRMTMGDSPLRGRVLHASAQHRHSLHKLRAVVAEHQPQPHMLSDASNSVFLSDTALSASRSRPAQSLAATLQHPIITTPAVSGANSRGHSPSAARYLTADEAATEKMWATTAAELRFLSDALCAVRQLDTRWFSRAAPRTDWGFCSDAAAADAHRTLSPSVVSVGLQLMATANLISELERRMKQLALLLESSADSSTADKPSRRTEAAQTALALAARASLTRFLVFARTSLHWYKTWLIALENYLAHLQTDVLQAMSSPLATTKSRRLDEAGAAVAAGSTNAHAIDGFASARVSFISAVMGGEDLLSLPLVAEHNAQVLSHCLSLCEALSDEAEDEEDGKEDERGGETSWIEAARTLLDTLIVYASAAQDASQLNEYRLYVMLLLACAWTYVPLITDAFFSRLSGVDAATWGRQLPLLFRTSLIPGQPGADVLSLILDCVDYPASRAWSSSQWWVRDVGSAAVSSCRYVLRSFANFAQKRRAVRGTASRRGVSARRGDEKVGVNAHRAESIRNVTEPGTCGPQERPVEEILAELVLSSHQNDNNEERAQAHDHEPAPITSFLTATQQKQLFRALPAPQATRHGVDATRTGHKQQAAEMVLATSIPLGFRTMAHELEGYRTWCCSLDNNPSRGSYSAAVSETEEEAEWTASRAGRGEAAAHSRLGMVWSLETLLDDHSKYVPDLFLHTTGRAERNGSAPQWPFSSASLASPSREASTRTVPPQHRRGTLWLDAAIPVTRWVVAALLVPLSSIAQRVQAQRLTALFARAPPRALADLHTLEATAMALDEEQAQQTDVLCHTEALTAGSEGDSLRMAASLHAHTTTSTTSFALRHLIGSMAHQARLLTVPSSFSLYTAVKLIVDVALCRDTERVVRRFLERLTEEPHWWFRRDAAHYADAGTASTFITTAFSDALRDKRFGGLVMLTVLPGPETDTVSDETTRADDVSSAFSSSSELSLDIFSSFQLHFALPESLAALFLPSALSLHVQDETGSLQSSYSTAFWQHRRGTRTPSSAHQSALRLRSTVGQLGSTRAHTVHNEPANTHTAPQADGVPFSDMWSYVFGYLCSLQYAQIALRQRQKQAQQQDVQDHQLLASVGGHTAASRRLQRVTRGLGSVFFTLSFAVDTLLTFAQREATICIHHLEHTLRRGQDGSIGSSMAFCRELDALLLELFLVCFPCRPPEMHTELERRAVSATSEAVRETVSAVLQLALNPTHLTPSMMSARVNNAVDALVVTVQSLRDATVLKSRLQPLVTLLTFNHFYGFDQQSNAYMFR